MVVKDALLATISHPYFKLKPILKEKRDALKQQLIDTANKLSSNVSEGFKCNKSSDTFFHWSDDEEETPQTQKNITSIEVLQFLEDSNNNLKSLCCYPKIKNVFLKFNRSLTLSAPDERLFSFASIILQGRRERLTDKNFEKLTLLKTNLFFIYFNLYIYPSDSQESDGGAIHRVSNYPDLLPEMPRYCCPLVS